MKLKDQLTLKLKLEKTFTAEVRRLFNRIKTDYRISISTSRPLRSSRYQSAWEAVLQNHYLRVQKAFRGIVKTDEKQIEDDEVTAARLAWSLTNGQKISKAITDTTQGNMDNSLTEARQAFSDEGINDYSHRELAVVSAVMLGRKLKGRESGIVITETQKAAESTKLIEAYGAADIDPMVAVTSDSNVASLSKKSWQDVGDKRVRPGHRASQVRSVPITEPFIVNGERLMYPGDNSMGASMSNTIGCRCSSLYIFN